MARSHLEVSFASSESSRRRISHTHIQTINARFRSAANSGTLKPRGVFNNRDNQFIRDIKDFYKNLKKRVKAHSDKVDDYESLPDASPDERDQTSDATAHKEDQTVAHGGSIDPSNEVCDLFAPTSLTKTTRSLTMLLTLNRTTSVRRPANTSMASCRETLPPLSPS